MMSLRDVRALFLRTTRQRTTVGPIAAFVLVLAKYWFSNTPGEVKRPRLGAYAFCVITHVSRLESFIKVLLKLSS